MLLKEQELPCSPLSREAERTAFKAGLLTRNQLPKASVTALLTSPILRNWRLTVAGPCGIHTRFPFHLPMRQTP